MKKGSMLYEKQSDPKVQCQLCAHRCLLPDNHYGLCGVRRNSKGTLYTLVYGEAVAANPDPIEKKPLYHFLPGSSAYSIATFGCNFKCIFCQNWQISQVSKQDTLESVNDQLPPKMVIAQAKKTRCSSIAYTYTEPAIFFEYAYDTARLAKQEGLKNIFVTNGYMTRKALDTIAPFLDAANVDLKSFNNDFYQKYCKAQLKPVLDSITSMKKLNIWIEITTLIIPGLNDSLKELQEIARFIARLDRDIPWHISRFHPNYRLIDTTSTDIDILRKASQIGRNEGLHYIYLGNVLEGNDTFCPQCHELLIKRNIFDVTANNVMDGMCAACGAKLTGIWK